MGWTGLDCGVTPRTCHYAVSQFSWLLVAVVESKLPDPGACKQTLARLDI